MREKLYVFDNQDNLLTVTYNYITAEFEETVEKPEGLTIEFPMTDDDAEHFVGGNQVAFRDLKGNFRLFVIREVDDQDGEATEKVIECFPAIQELTDVMIEEKRPQDQDAEYVLGVILENSRWQVGEVAELGKNSTSYYFDDAYESLGNLTDLWGGEIIDRIEIDKNKIAGRFIDIVNKKGENNGKRFEIGKDIKNITRTVLYYPKTALYGKGSSLELEDDEGESTGGHSRKITFRDVVWKESDGDPVDKPKGQEWVGDPEAKKKHGIPNPLTVNLDHRFGIFEDNDEEDPKELLKKTWEAVQDEKEPKAQYEMDIETFYGVSDYEHEQVFLGDTGIARDKSIKPMILVESRVMSWKYDIGNPENGKVKLGNILDLSESNTDIDWVIDKVKDNGSKWDSGGDPITDEKFPDKVPPVPKNVKVDGLYQTIMLSWDFDSAFYIASYEVYASQTKGFAPDSTNRVFRGKTGGYNHNVETNDKWYFRLRAVNTHGTASEYTDEYSASTAKVNFDDIDEDNIPDFIEHSIYRGEEAPNPKEYKYWINTSKSPELLYRYDEESEKWKALAPTKPGDLGAVELGEYQDKINEIIDDISDKAGLKYVDGQLKDKVSQKDYEEERQEILDGIADKVDADWVDGKLISKVDKETYDDKMDEVGKEIADKADFDWVDGKLKDKADETELKDVKDDLATKVDGEWVDGKLKSKADADTTYTIEQVDDALDNKVGSAEYKTDKDGYVERFNENESSIKQNEKEIRTKVDSKEYEALEDTVDTNTTDIKQNAKEITSKASQESLDTVTGKVDENESSIKQNAKEITSKVSQSSYDKDKEDNVKRYEENESAIEQNAKEITSKVSQTEYDADIDELGTQVSKAQTDITQNAKEIKSKASQEELDSTKQSVKDNASEISQNAKEIKSKVSQTEYDDLSDDVSKNTSSIKQNADKIESKVDATEYKEDKNGIISDIKDNSSSIEQNAKEIKSKVDETYVTGAIDDIEVGGRNLLLNSDFSNGKLNDWNSANYGKDVVEDSILKTEITRKHNAARLERKIKLKKGTYTVTLNARSTKVYQFRNFENANITTVKVKANDEFEVNSATFNVKDDSEVKMRMYLVDVEEGDTFEIEWAKVEKGTKATDYSPAPEDVQDQIDDTNEVVKTQGTEITQNAEEIASKASQSSVDTINGKVSDNESSIKQQAKLIEQRVKSTDYKKDQDDIVSDLESHETRITQTEKDITSKVDSTTYKSDKDSLEKDIKNNTSEITQNAEAIKSKVDATTYKSDKDGITKDIKDNKSEIEQNANAITSKVEQKDIDGAIEGVEVGVRNLLLGTSDEYKKIKLGTHANKIEENSILLLEDLGIETGDYVTFRLYINAEEEDYGGAARLTFYSKKSAGEDDDKDVVRSEEVVTGGKKGYSSLTYKIKEKNKYVTFWINNEDSGTNHGQEIQYKKSKFEIGNKATDWTPAPEDTEAEIDSVREYASEIEQTAKGIASNVTSLEKDVDSNKTNISDARSDIKQQADEITQRVTKTTHKADMDRLDVKVSEAESSIKQNAEEITSRVSKNGVISSINQTAESVTIDADRLNIKGDLNVVDGNVRIQKGIITNEMVAGSAKIDFAKIADVKITNAMIDSVVASKIKSGTLDAEKVMVRVKRDNRAIQMDEDGFKSYANGKVRIHIGVRNLAGKGQSDPSTIRFFSGNGSNAAGVGMNVNDTFIIGSENKAVGMELRTHYSKNIIHYGQQHRFVTKNEKSNSLNSKYWIMRSRTSGGDENPVLEPSTSGWGFLGVSSRRLWYIHTNSIKCDNLVQNSTRDVKENIKTVDVKDMQDVFDQVTIAKWHYKSDDKKSTTLQMSYGPIAEESPKEILNPDGKSLVLNNYINVIASSLKYQTQRVDELEEEKRKTEKTLESQHERIAQLEIIMDEYLGGK